MAEHLVTFDLADVSAADVSAADAGARPGASPATKARVQTGTLLTEAARLADVEISQPCGGQGRCGRCLVQLVGESNGSVRRRSTLRLSSQDVESGFALACQSVVEGDVTVIVPEQEKVARRLTTDLRPATVAIPAGYDYRSWQTIQRFDVTVSPPSMDDQRDDWSRLQTALRKAIAENSAADTRIASGEWQVASAMATISLPLLRRIGEVLRDAEWQVSAVVDLAPLLAYESNSGDAPPASLSAGMRLIDLRPTSGTEESPLWGAAIDIGTTTVTVWLVDLVSGRVQRQAAEYNGQIARGEDVISRIIYATKSAEQAGEMRSLVLDTINGLLTKSCERSRIEATEIVKCAVTGNSAMMHLLLGIPAESIRLMPFVTAVNHLPSLRAQEVGLDINPEAAVDCLPGVASYVGADISGGVLASGLDDSPSESLFLDIGTNGETVLGSSDWLVSCACSAGPAFEGAGVQDGMRATRGAIEEVWINGSTHEPTYRVIGGVKPRGLCGSGLISLLAELFLNGIVDKGGHFNATLGAGAATKRVRQGEHGLEYVIAWANETAHGRDIAITRVDVDNLLRAKAAIYAGFTVLAERVGLPLEAVERVLIGGAFGKYINVEKAVEIGLLPDMPWDCFHFLGNTAVLGAYLALLDRNARARIQSIAERMTYIELSADNTFYEAFTSALFLPHTDMSRFQSVAEELARMRAQGVGEEDGNVQEVDNESDGPPHTTVVHV
jgi:uncharacterized 2Fe-2S/4Fe-4S cluster protein (DUF4445 family)